MQGLVVWVAGPPDCKIDGDGVLLSFRSGDVKFTNRMSRADFRMACECGIRLLNDADAEEAFKVLPFERCG